VHAEPSHWGHDCAVWRPAISEAQNYLAYFISHLNHRNFSDHSCLFIFQVNFFFLIDIWSRRYKSSKGTMVVAWLKYYHIKNKKIEEKGELGG
jgi:hypothetical protein